MSPKLFTTSFLIVLFAISVDAFLPFDPFEAVNNFLGNGQGFGGGIPYLNNLNPFDIASYILGQNGRGYRGPDRYPNRQGSINVQPVNNAESKSDSNPYTRQKAEANH